MHGGRLATIFSARNYCESHENVCDLLPLLPSFVSPQLLSPAPSLNHAWRCSLCGYFQLTFVRMMVRSHYLRWMRLEGCSAGLKPWHTLRSSKSMSTGIKTKSRSTPITTETAKFDRPYRFLLDIYRPLLSAANDDSYALNIIRLLQVAPLREKT
jgi:hypothetical protein